MSLQILLVDDHQIVREGLRSLLVAQLGAKVTEASNGREAIELAAQIKPDAVVMDIAMPGLNGIEATRRIIAANPNTRVVVLSAHLDPHTASAIAASGAVGYLPKDAAFDELVDAIQRVTLGQTYVSPKLSSVLLDSFTSSAAATASAGAGAGDGNGDARSAFSRLTSREREVLQLIAEGRATKEIARDLNVSVKTVETHRRQLMEKLHLYSVAELTKYAVREGISSLQH